jgi:hypothetical protein
MTSAAQDRCYDSIAIFFNALTKLVVGVQPLIDQAIKGSKKGRA